MPVAVIAFSLRPHRSGYIVTILRHGVNTLRLLFETKGLARWISLRQPPTWYVLSPMRGSRLQGEGWRGSLAWREGGRREGEVVALSHQISVAGAGSTLAGRSGSGFPRLSPDFGPPSIASSHVPDEHGELRSAAASTGPMLSFAADATARSSPRHGRDTLPKPLQEGKGTPRESRDRSSRVAIEL